MKSHLAMKSLFLIVTSLFTSVVVAAVGDVGLKVEVLQMRVSAGDFDFTLKEIAEKYSSSNRNGVDLLVLPEGIIPGYPSYDVLNEKDYILRSEQAVEQI